MRSIVFALVLALLWFLKPLLTKYADKKGWTEIRDASRYFGTFALLMSIFALTPGFSFDAEIEVDGIVWTLHGVDSLLKYGVLPSLIGWLIGYLASGRIKSK